MSSKKTSFDWLTILIYLLLVGTGVLAIYTATYDESNPSLFNLARSHGKQVIFVGISLLVAAVIQLFDTRFFTGFSYIIYGAVLLLLFSTLFIGSEISGSRSWIRLGFFNLQTAELGKFATCLALAKYLSSFKRGITEFAQQLFAATLIIIPMLFILLQGDAGSALVFTALILVLYREGLSGGFLLLGAYCVILFILSLITVPVYGIPAFYVLLGGLTMVTGIVLLYFRRKNIRDILTYALPLLIVGSISYYLALPPTTQLAVFGGCALFFGMLSFSFKQLPNYLTTFIFASAVFVSTVDYTYNNILKPHQRNRIGVLLGLVEDRRGIGYNLNQSKIAIGSGGLWGRGYLQGTQNKGSFVPELHTDFIFCTIGEEFGFMGSFFLIGLFALLLVRIVMIAERQRSRFSRIYAYGVASILFFHLFVNIGMTVGMVPVIGIPLPFISYGGSSLLGFTVLLFILVKLDSERMMILR